MACTARRSCPRTIQNDFSRSRIGKALNARRHGPDSDQPTSAASTRTRTCRTTIRPACRITIFGVGGVTPEQLAYLQIPGAVRRRDDRAGPERLDLRRPRPVRHQAADGERRSRVSRSARSIARSARSCAPTRTTRRTTWPARARRRSTRSAASTCREVFAEARLPLAAGQAVRARRCRSKRATATRTTTSASTRTATSSASSGRRSKRSDVPRQLSARSALAEHPGAVPAAACAARRHHRSVLERRSASTPTASFEECARTRRDGRAVRQHPRRTRPRSTTAWSAAIRISIRRSRTRTRTASC